MKYVSTGDGKIPLMSLLAILSISLTVNLPGLAISPIMGKLDTVFRHVTELEIQLLTVLPNFVTIPFILGSGKICTEKNQIRVLGIGLGIFALTGVGYFFAASMIELILLSCLLGVGCGLVIPLAASLISQNFVGEARTDQLGVKSGVSNFSVILATLFVGWMASIDWHMSFIVYMVPLVPLALLPFMTNGYISRHKIRSAADAEQPSAPSAATQAAPTGKDARRAAVSVLACVMGLYLLVTYGVEVVSYYLPFCMSHDRLSTDDVGVTTAIFFAAISLGGFLLTRIIGLFGVRTLPVAIGMMVAGLGVVGLLHNLWSYNLGILMMGLGYGVIQPMLYDKTSTLAPDQDRSTAYFSYLLACNYVGVSIVPFVVSAANHVFDAQHHPNFSFLFNAAVMLVLLALAIWKRKKLDL